jgi:hypothetical protein
MCIPMFHLPFLNSEGKVLFLGELILKVLEGQGLLPRPLFHAMESWTKTCK